MLLLAGNDGHRNFTSITGLSFNPGASTSMTYAVAWGDFDGDGRADIAIGNDNLANELHRVCVTAGQRQDLGIVCCY